MPSLFISHQRFSLWERYWKWDAITATSKELLVNAADVLYFTAGITVISVES